MTLLSVRSIRIVHPIGLRPSLHNGLFVKMSGRDMGETAALEPKPIVKEPTPHLPTDAATRKKIPVFSGVVKYFPDALVAVAKVSQAGNDQHNPGQPLHWSRGKSDDHHDTLLRHLIDSGTIDSDGHRHSAKVAWRALAILQLEIEADAAKETA